MKNVLLIERDDWLKKQQTCHVFRCDTTPPKKGGVAVHINLVFDILVDQNGGRRALDRFLRIVKLLGVAW